MAEEERAERNRGPKGGRKHTPGRGHRRKSEALKKKRFQRKAATKRRAEHDELRAQWHEWDALSAEQQRLLPDMKPIQPRPDDESQSTS